jgi:hypothetical protein
VRGVTSQRALAVLLVAAAAAAAVALNVLLLGKASAGNDPVGKLRPIANLPAAATTTLPAAPGWTVRPTTGRLHDEGADD